jgi:hypothetical protein
MERVPLVVQWQPTAARPRSARWPPRCSEAERSCFPAGAPRRADACEAPGELGTSSAPLRGARVPAAVGPSRAAACSAGAKSCSSTCFLTEMLNQFPQAGTEPKPEEASEPAESGEAGAERARGSRASARRMPSLGGGGNRTCNKAEAKPQAGRAVTG